MSEPPVLAYHRRSKNRPGRPAAAPRRLDRSIEPVPFRRYRGAALLPLPEIPPVDGPAWGELFIPGAVAPAPLDREAVARLFFDSLAISAWREEAGARFSFRVNPSAGNLHPTEAYLLAGPLPGLHDRAALYHYSPFDHALEIRADLPDGGVPPGTLL
ncbi:MAG TPA: SagB-type dehydrogenase, partial [Acidobacteria bacterium]|nr:SagB-type dehydrogenase [Acidobacteriota bacterium]